MAHLISNAKLSKSVSQVLIGCLWITATAAVAKPSQAAAERKISLLSGHAELFGAHLIDDPNRKLYGFGAGGALRLELNLAPWIGIQVGGIGLWLSKDESPDSTNYGGLAVGPRFHWAEWTGSRNDGWLDVNFAWGSSGGQRRPGFDVGLGYEFALRGTDWFRLGPFVRYQWGRSANLDNPSLLMFGLAATLGYRGEDKAKSADAAASKPGDMDGDGVLDVDDACPTVHQGANPDAKRPGCPSFDADGDGVLDKDDACPQLHQGPNPDPQRRGCPQGDRDGDTIADAVDACPDEPGAPSTDPQRNGCPGLVRITSKRIEIQEPVYFATNEDRILEKSYPVLKAVADALIASPRIKSVRVEGHTDSRASDEFNLDLSRRRATRVVEALQRLGVEPSRVYPEGLGESRPVDSNNTTLGRAANRRVEFHIVEQQ